MRLHPLSAVRDALQRAVYGFSTVFFLSSMANVALNVDLGYLFVLAPLGGLLGAGYGVARYALFEYDLTDDSLDVRSGVVARQEREIPLGRVQNVDVERTLVQRALGVAVLRVETAGGGETEAVLDLVSHGEAERLQRELRERKRSRQPPDTEQAVTDADRTTPGADTVDAPAPEHRFSLSTGELVVYSLVAFRPRSALALFVLVPFAWGVVGDGLLALARPLGGPDTLAFSALSTLSAGEALALLAVAVPLLAVAVWAVSALSTFAGYYGFRLGRRGDNLVYERGLLQRYSGSIPLGKVQTLTVSESLPARLLGYAGLHVETAGYAPGREVSRAASAVPFARRERVLALARELESFDDLTVERPPRRARRRYAVRYLLAVLGVAAVWYAATALVGLGGPTLRLLPLVGLPVVPFAAHFAWASRGHRVGEENAILREGFWTRHTHVVPHYRLQTVETQRTVFQRRLDLADVTADTASSATLTRRDATAHDVDSETARALHRTLRERLQSSVERARFR